MKVICIDATKYADTLHPKIIEGNIYTTDGEPPNSPSHYTLLEVPGVAGNGLRWGYKKSRFIPLSTIDEMELLHNRQTELA